MDNNFTDNFNDLYILFLLDLKEPLTIRESVLLKKLKRIYPNYEEFRNKIVNKLSSYSMLEYVNGETYIIENGNPAYINDLPKFYKTNSAGMAALKNNLFKSESLIRLSEKRFKRLEITALVIAAVGGLITIINFIFNGF